MAWVEATPVGAKLPRHSLLKRIQYPDKTPCQYLIDYFILLRKGTRSISFTELINFSRLNGAILTPMESELLIEMGYQYNSFLQEAIDPNCPNPIAKKKEVTKGKMISIMSHMRVLKASQEHQQSKKRKG